MNGDEFGVDLALPSFRKREGDGIKKELRFIDVEGTSATDKLK